MDKIWLPITGFVLVSQAVVIQYIGVDRSNNYLLPESHLLQWLGIISFILAWIGIALLGASISLCIMLGLQKIFSNVKLFRTLATPVTILTFLTILGLAIGWWNSGMH